MRFFSTVRDIVVPQTPLPAGANGQRADQAPLYFSMLANLTVEVPFPRPSLCAPTRRAGWTPTRSLTGSPASGARGPEPAWGSVLCSSSTPRSEIEVADRCGPASHRLRQRPPRRPTNGLHCDETITGRQSIVSASPGYQAYVRQATNCHLTTPRNFEAATATLTLNGGLAALTWWLASASSPPRSSLLATKPPLLPAQRTSSCGRLPTLFTCSSFTARSEDGAHAHATH